MDIVSGTQLALTLVGTSDRGREMGGSTVKLAGFTQDAIIELNTLVKITCKSCRHPIGYSASKCECDDPFHQAMDRLLDHFVEELGATRCQRCGMLTLKPWNDGVHEPGNMAWGGGWFCWHCWHGSFEDRR